MSARIPEDYPATGGTPTLRSDGAALRFANNDAESKRFTVAKIRAFPAYRGIFKATATQPGQGHAGNVARWWLHLWPQGIGASARLGL